MSMQERANCDSQEKSFGEISDQHLQQPQDERKAVQKRTFTRWLNLFLQRCDPPVEVHDLFTDIQDGRILMALLEELSGCKLVRIKLYRTQYHCSWEFPKMSNYPLNSKDILSQTP
uniref:Calponin-homology (CH) domain-containing protein n=1 Tax=Seriola dumerili TaxID=41447 RepID=A0A3B4TSC9_SERDU